MHIKGCPCGCFIVYFRFRYILIEWPFHMPCKCEQLYLLEIYHISFPASMPNINLISAK